MQVSVLGYGAAPIGYLATDQEKVARVLNVLLDAGYVWLLTSGRRGSLAADADSNARAASPA